MGVDYDQVLKQAEEKGWTVRRTKGSHLELKSPCGEHTVHASGTPSDHRAALNLRADLRRAGLDTTDSKDTTDGKDAGGEHMHRGELLTCVRAIFSEQPEHIFTLDEMWTRVHARLPVAKRSSTEQTVYTLLGRHEIKRVDKGQYRLRTVEHDTREVRTADFQQGGVPAGMQTGDQDVDEDARILDEALAALGRIQERIVERVHAVLQEEVQRALEPLAKVDSVTRRTREALAAVARARAALRIL